MNVKGVIATTLLAGTLAVGGASAAQATTEWPNVGGRWDYGYSLLGRAINSDYFHNGRCHGSTVVSDDRVNRSQDIVAGRTAHAGLGWVDPWEGKEYYYRVC